MYSNSDYIIFIFVIFYLSPFILILLFIPGICLGLIFEVIARIINYFIGIYKKGKKRKTDEAYAAYLITLSPSNDSPGKAEKAYDTDLNTIDYSSYTIEELVKAEEAYVAYLKTLPRDEYERVKQMDRVERRKREKARKKLEKVEKKKKRQEEENQLCGKWNAEHDAPLQKEGRKERS